MKTRAPSREENLEHLAPSREENLEHLKEYFFERIKEEDDNLLKYIISASWGNGYNLVLDACWEVLPREDYWKIVNKLEEWENENENN